MNKRHAYLIMAHNEFDVLIELLIDLDDERNDIYLHIDKKVESFQEEKIQKSVARGNLYLIERKFVNWGGYSQIDCELRLLENALKNSNYSYYHLLTGVSFPIKSQNYIHNFFIRNSGKQFVGFDRSKDYGDRLRYVHLFNEIGKADSGYKIILYGVRSKFIKFQKLIGYRRIQTKGVTIKKGLVYWSITQEAAKYLVDNKKKIKDLCRYSVCGDEMFVQTLLTNSEFSNSLYQGKDELGSCLRVVKPSISYGEGKYIDWNGEVVHIAKEGDENVIAESDIDYLLRSDGLFALKFGGENTLKTIKKIKLSRI